jgi:CheY-like chemotaxis protein
LADILGRKKKPTVLVIDDDEKNLKLVKAILNANNYEVADFTSGRSAIDAMGDIDPDLILLDIMMPGMSGFEVCRELKEHRETRDIPVIFLTAKAEADDVVTGFQTGSVDYITKPFHSAELLARVRTHVELKVSRDIKKRDLLHARSIQQRMLSTEYKDISCLDLALQYLPLDELGGDVYDITEIRPRYIRIFLADATGHGLQAALLFMLIKCDYEKIKLRLKHPDQVLDLLNREIIATYGALSVFFPALVIDIDVDNGKVSYSSAGFPTQYYLSPDDTAVTISQTGAMLGIGNDSCYEMEQITVHKGGRLLLFTDGLLEQLSCKNSADTDNMIIETMRQSAGKSVQELVTYFSQFEQQQSMEHIDRALKDDTTILGVEIM